MIKVISITPENPELFDEEIIKQPAFVKIYQPWCGYCKKVAPVWDALSEELNKNYTGNVSIIEVHGDALDNIKSDLVKNVNGFPTIFSVKDGVKQKDYNGDRSLEDMLRFIVREADLKENPKTQLGGGRRKSRRHRTKSKYLRKSRMIRRTRRQRRHTRTYSRRK